MEEQHREADGRGDFMRGCRRILDSAGEREVSREDALRLHEAMVYLRLVDERSSVFHRQGRIGTWAVSWGHEAIHVGAMAGLRDGDWAFPSYRENKIGLLRGMDPADVLSGCRGQPEGWWDPGRWRLGPIAIPVASQVPHAVGFAWGERLQGRDTVALAFFGDGATSEGEFHEGANYAGVFKAPVVLLCTNNQWAISTPIHRQSAAAALADKAPGYGMPGVRVDGNDVLAVREAVQEAAERARQGKGPTLIEACIYRAQAHAFPDDPSLYRDDTEAAEARRNECLTQFEAFLRRREWWDDARDARHREEIVKRLSEAMNRAEERPDPGPGCIFENVLAEPTPAMRRDLAELRRDGERT